jgi:hypothetical protein
MKKVPESETGSLAGPHWPVLPLPLALVPLPLALGPILPVFFAFVTSF